MRKIKKKAVDVISTVVVVRAEVGGGGKSEPPPVINKPYEVFVDVKPQ